MAVRPQDFAQKTVKYIDFLKEIEYNIFREMKIENNHFKKLI